MDVIANDIINNSNDISNDNNDYTTKTMVIGLQSLTKIFYKLKTALFSTPIFLIINIGV